jgi:uncharacterized protein GlcG (DUF336 family)
MISKADASLPTQPRRANNASETKPGRPISFAVTDGAGILTAFVKMDGASPLTARMVERCLQCGMFLKNKNVIDTE